MSMSMFFRNFLTLTHMDVKNNSCHETRETEQEDDDPEIQKTPAVSSDDDSNSIASSNTEICGDIDNKDLEICDEEAAEVVRKEDVNDFPPSECDGSFGVNNSLCKVRSVQSVVSEQVVESANNKQKDPIQKPSNKDCETTAVSSGKVESRPFLLIPVDLCGKGTEEICIEKRTSIKGSIVTSPLEEELVATKESYLSSIPNSSNTALLNASEGPNKTIDHCVGKTRESPMKTVESYINGITDQRQLLRKAYGQDNNKTHLLSSQVKSDHCRDETQTETAQELVLSSSNSTAVADQLPDKEDHVEHNSKAEEKTAQEPALSSNCTDPLKVLQDNASLVENSSHPFQLENSKVVIETSFTKVPSRLSATHSYQGNGYSTKAVKRKPVSLASGIVYEDEVSAVESLQNSTTTQTLLSGTRNVQSVVASKPSPGVLRRKEHVVYTNGNKRPFSCGICGKAYKIRQSVFGHIKIHHEEKRYSCKASKPSPGVSAVSRRKEHVVYTNGNERPFSCGICGKAYKIRHSVFNHIVHHHEEKRYSCKSCGKHFSHPSDLAKHVLIHSQEKSFTCDQCGKQFRFDTTLRHHKYKHSDERLFSCNQCNKTYKTKTNLSWHKESHKTEEEKKGVACDICKRKLGSPSHLKQHMMIHTGEKPFKCTLCEKEFSMETNLRRHMDTHSGKKRLAKDPCSICGKTLWAARMHDHMNMHAGVKPFECNICGKRFPKKPNLEGHMRSHTGEKPFACDRCDKRFALYSNMVTHKAKCAVLSDTLA